MWRAKHCLQAPVAPQALQNVALDTIDIIHAGKETPVAIADLAWLHSLDVSKIDQDALFLPVEFFLNDLPQSLCRNTGDDIIGGIVGSRLMLYGFQRLFILARLPRAYFIGNNAVHAHLEIFQYSRQRVEVLHLGRRQRLRKLGEGGIDQWSAAILPQKRRRALVLCNPGEHKRRVLLIDAGPGILIAPDDGATK